jgi:hypothetical protein
MSRSSLFVCTAVLAGTATIGWAAPPRPLPDFDLVSLERPAAAGRGAFTSTASVPREQEADGERVVPAASLVREGRWLLVYVSPHSGGSGPLLHALEGEEGSARPTLVIVVADRSAAAKAMAAGFERRMEAHDAGTGGEVAESRGTFTCTALAAPGQGCPGRGRAWYADPDGAARRALGLTGVPVVLGMEGGEIRWTLSGAVADRRRLRSILVSWR